MSKKMSIFLPSYRLFFLSKWVVAVIFVSLINQKTKINLSNNVVAFEAFFCHLFLFSNPFGLLRLEKHTPQYFANKNAILFENCVFMFKVAFKLDYY
jgi:hypothetical protein